MHVNDTSKTPRENFWRCLMAGISEINILSELCIAAKPAIVTLDKVRSESWKSQQMHLKLQIAETWPIWCFGNIKRGRPKKLFQNHNFLSDGTSLCDPLLAKRSLGQGLKLERKLFVCNYFEELFACKIFWNFLE